MSFHTHYPSPAYSICKTVLRQSWPPKTKIITENRHRQSSTDAPQPTNKNQQPTTMNADDDRLLSTYIRQPVTQRSKTIKANNRYWRPTLNKGNPTNDSLQPIPVSYSWPGKNNNKRLSTTNKHVLVCMRLSSQSTYLSKQLYPFFVHENNGFWMYCLWKVYLIPVCGRWRLQSVHFPACKFLKRLLENLRKAPDLKVSNRLASMDLFTGILHFYIHSIIGVFTNTFLI